MRFFDIIPRLNRSQLDRDLRRLQGERHNINVDANVNGNRNVENLNENIHNLNNTGGDSHKVFSDLRIKMGMYLTVIKAVNDAIRGSIKTIKSYDDYTTDLSMAMGSTREEAEKYLVTLSQKGKTLKATVGEMAEGADSFIRQGKTMAETETLIENSMVLSKVAKMDSADSTDVLTAAMNSFNIAAEDTISVIDKLTAVDLVSASSADGLGIALGKSASAAKLAGIELDKLISMLAVMKEAAPSESDQTIGNAMKSILSRMNQVKAGKFIDEETGESLNDVEKVLSKVSISLRDTNGQFIESEKVLDEVGQKWNSFDSVTQRAISTAIAGSYQYNRFISLMDGYSKVLKYTEVAQNSSGQAMEKFQNYEESLEAKTKLLQNSLESLAYDTFGNEFYDSVLDATTGLIQFIEKTEALKTGLTVLGIVGGAKLFTAIATSIVGAVKHLNDFNTALSIIKNGNVASSFGTLLACTEGLNQSQLRLILTSQALNNQQRVAILTRKGLTEEEIAATLATLNLANAEGAATGATATLTGTVKGLGASLKALAVANPIMTILTVLGLIVFGAVKAYDALTLSVEEANEALDESLSQYEESKSELESVTSELESQQKAMDDLLAKDKLTYAEQGQLEELQEITKELLLQKNIAERKAESDAKQVAKDTVQAFNTQYGKFDISKDEIDYNVSLMKESGSLISSNENNISGKLAELENLKRLIEETEQQLSNTRELSKQEIKILESDYQDYLDLYEKTEGQVSDALADLEEKRQALADGYQLALEKQNNGETLSTTEKDSIETYNKIADAMRLIYEYTNPNAWNTIEIDKIFNTDGLAETKEELIALAKSGTLSPATLASYTALNDAIEDSDLMLKEGQTAYSALCDEIYALAEAQEDVAEIFEENPIVPDLSISQTIDNLNTQLKPTFDALKDAYQDIFKSDDGEIKFSLDDVDISTFESIKSAIEELDKIDGVTINYDDFCDFVEVLSNTSSTSEEVQAQFDKLSTSIVYASDCTEMSKDNFDLLCKSLYEMGLVNAPEVLKNIRSAQEELKASGIDLKNVTDEEAKAFLNEAEASEIAKEYLRMYMIQKQLANKPLSTSADVKALENLCNSLGVTGEMLKWVASLKSALGAVDAGAPIQSFQSQIDTANQKIAELAASGGSFSFDFNSNITSPSSKSSKDSKSDKPSTETYDWIETKISRLETAIDELDQKATDTYLSLAERTKAYGDEISKVTEEIGLQTQAYNSYMTKANSYGLSADWVQKIQSGALQIDEVTDDTLKEQISNYKEWYDKAQECLNTVDDLQRNLKDLKIANIQLKIDDSSATVTKLEQEAEKIENRLDNEYKKTNSKDYDKLNKNISSRMSELEKQNGLLKEQQSIAGKDTEKWKELAEQIRENNLSLDEFNKKITENKIAKIQIDVEIKETALNKLEKLLDKLSWNTSLKGVFGGLASGLNYTLQNKNLMKQIKNLNQTNTLIAKQQKEVKRTSKAWSDYQSQIQDNNASIRTLMLTMAENAVAKASLADEKANKKIEKYDSQDELNKAKSENATNYKTQNKYIDKEIANIDKRLSAYRQAETTNLSGLNSSIKSINRTKVTNSNKSLLTEIKKYTSSKKEIPASLLLKASQLNDNGNLANKLYQYNAFLAAYQTSKDTATLYAEQSKQEKTDFLKEQMSNTATYYENRLKSLEQNQTKIDNKMAIAETLGYEESSAYYKKQRDIENNKISMQRQEVAALEQRLAEGLAGESIKEGSNEWYELIQQIDDCKNAIDESTKSVAEFNNKIREIEWNRFDSLQGRIDNVRDELSWIVDELSREDLTSDDIGGFTENGRSVAYIRAVEYETLKSQAEQYKQELDNIEKEIAKNPSDSTLIEQKQKLYDSYRDCIKGAEDEKDAIIDLYSNGYNSLSSKLKELISDFNELLDAEKDAYDYQQNIADKTKELSKLRKQLLAYSGDISEETRASIQKINVSLEDAQKSLQETQYDKYISDTKEMLSDLQEDFYDAVQDIIDSLRVNFEELKNEISNSATSSAATISEKLNELGYKPTEDTKIVLDASNFDIGLDENGNSKTLDGVVKSVVKNIEKFSTALNDAADALADKQSNPNSLNDKTTEEEIKDKAFEENATLKKKELTETKTDKTFNDSSETIKQLQEEAQKAEQSYNKAMSDWQSARQNVIDLKKELSNIGKRYGTKSKKYQEAKENLETARALRDKMKAIRDGKESDYVESLKRLEQLKSLKGYAKGSKHVTEDLAWTQENGGEIIRTSDGAILTPVGKGGMVFTNEMSQRLWELSKNPNLFKNNISGVNINIPDIQSSYQSGDVNITFGDIELPNVTDSAEFASSVESAVRDAVCKNGKTLTCITEAVSAKQLGKGIGHARLYN